VSCLTLDVGEWAQENFGECDLGDVRRTRRAVTVARQMAEHPDGSTPDQAEDWSDLKATYRLFDEATFAAVATPHWRRTRSLARGTVLLIGDTTETDFGLHRAVTGLGPTGDGYGLGFFLHSSMMVDAASGEILGLAGQELFYRQPAPKNENSYQARQRSRESEVWGRVVELVGSPAAGVRFVHVFDRGADNLDVFCHCRQQRTDWVIRAAQLHRVVEQAGLEAAEQRAGATRLSLRVALVKQPLSGTYELSVAATKDHEARTAKLQVRFAQVTIRRPKRPTKYQRALDFQELTQGVVETREVNPPKGVTPLHWVLWTSLPVTSFEDACQIIEYYERRWLIEELHKAIKTGCRLEARQYLEAHRLEAVAGFTCVLAVRLLQLKTVAPTNPDLPAERVVPAIWLKMLSALRKRTLTTVRDFFRHLAGLGGFLLRKRDGNPGWITLWRGLDKLLLAIRGFVAMNQRCG
jgi:Transposase DNA-binding/Transposase DDE domain